MTKESTELKNRMKAVFRNRGIRIGAKVYDPRHREELIKQLPLPAQRTRVLRLAEVLDVVTEKRVEARADLVKAARQNSMYKSLITIPQLGDIWAATVIAEVGTPHRFRSRKQFWSYAGLAVRTFETSQYYADNYGQVHKKPRAAKTRGLVREFNTSLKCMFKHMAVTLGRTDWKFEFDRLKRQGVIAANARLTLARKAAAITLRIMKTGEMYDESLVFPRK
ncbi:hypothetical protein BVY02_01065 [bacterium J17]|nr:hypothetical protein BVY02_01065 [bacterium J17]